MKKPLLIIICPYPFNKAPSQRFRFEQQLPFLETHFEIKQLSFWSKKTNNILYTEGKIVKKIMGLCFGIISRIYHLTIIRKADIIFIHREIIPLGSYFFEWFIAKILKKKIIFDFDDAIWNLDTSAGNKHLEWLKSSRKTTKIISISSLITAGNNYLANYAKQYNNNTLIIPTTIDTSYHIPCKQEKKDAICIGWTGSTTTIKHFKLIEPVLINLKKKYGSKIYFKVIGDPNYSNHSLHLKGISWNINSEIKDLQEIDIGIMPLPNDEWAKGKCGFKGLQYMALEIPTIMSPVGVNTEIINEAVNGYIANTEKEWIDLISKLIETPELREKIGKEGRKTIIKNYSIKSQKNNYLQAFTNFKQL